LLLFVFLARDGYRITNPVFAIHFHADYSGFSTHSVVPELLQETLQGITRCFHLRLPHPTPGSGLLATA